MFRVAVVGHCGAPVGKYEKVDACGRSERLDVVGPAETGDPHCEQMEAESDNSVLHRGQNMRPPIPGFYACAFTRRQSKRTIPLRRSVITLTTSSSIDSPIATGISTSSKTRHSK